MTNEEARELATRGMTPEQRAEYEAHIDKVSADVAEFGRTMAHQLWGDSPPLREPSPFAMREAEREDS